MEVVTIPIAEVMEQTGYKMETTFWQDFSIADRFGLDAVQDTFNRAFEEWKSNHIYLTELVLVLNWKIWTHYKENAPQDAPENAMARLYNDLWEQADIYARENLTGDELQYFYEVTN